MRAALAEVLSRIDRACSRAGRPAQSVRLVAVSKTWPAERIVELAGHGQLLFGENRVQEAQEKIPRVVASGVRADWHLIGPLQRNKVRHAVGLFSLLHGVDSERLLVEVDRRAAAAGIVQELLLQVDVAGEPSKAGVAPEGLEPLALTARSLEHVRVRGLMAIPPRHEPRRWFDALRELRDRTASRLGDPLPELSMGMSGDYELAIEAGATLVRVGTAIFGPRETPRFG